MEVLVLDAAINICWSITSLLARAGFSIDVVSASPAIRFSKFIRQLQIVESRTQIAEAANARLRGRSRPYDLVVATDDTILELLRARVEQSLSPVEILPILPGRSTAHLYSKIGLSRLFEEGGIRTPPFRVACSRNEAAQAARELDYPVMVKIDASGGGGGVFACAAENQIAALPDIFGKAVLVQKAISGATLDLSAIFLRGDLVHFSHSVITTQTGRFGPSVVRRYRPLSMVEPAIFDELAGIGRALGIHGFTNITCIDADDGSGRHYFECDLRPNTWADYSTFIGEDPALRVRRWYADGTALTPENAAQANQSPTERTIPHFLRMPVTELVRNAHGVWGYIPTDDMRLLRRLILDKTMLAALASASHLVPRALRRRVRSLLAAAGVPWC